MAKSLRSKIKRHYRAEKAKVVDEHAHTKEKEEKRQEVMDSALMAPKRAPKRDTMDVDSEEEDIDEQMAVDGRLSDAAVKKILKEVKVRKLARKARYSRNAKRQLKRVKSSSKSKL